MNKLAGPIVVVIIVGVFFKQKNNCICKTPFNSGGTVEEMYSRGNEKKPADFRAFSYFPGICAYWVKKK